MRIVKTNSKLDVCCAIQLKTHQRLDGKYASDVCRSAVQRTLTSLRSQRTPPSPTLFRGRELWRLKLSVQKHVGIRR